MKTVCKTVYQYNELSDEAKERARDWFREGNLDYAWWDFIYEDAKTIGTYLGFSIDRIYFSGFWNQGDGACFKGTWSAKDMDLLGLVGHAPQNQELHRIGHDLANIAQCVPGSSLAVKSRGHYSHEYYTDFSVTIDEDTEEPSGDVEEVFTGEEQDRFEESLVELSRDFMRWIYRQLEKEYEYLQADEQVEEGIRLNEYDFNEDGIRA